MLSIDHVRDKILARKSRILIYADINLKYTDGAVIWLSNLINTKICSGYNVDIINNHTSDFSNIERNIENNSKCNFYYSSNATKKITELNNKNNYEFIVIRGINILKELDNNILQKTCIYAMDIHLNDILILKENYKELWCQSDKFGNLYSDNGVNKNKIKITPPIAYKYNFDLLERSDNEIRLIYCGTLRDEENILEIIEQFKKIHIERPEIVLNIVYGKIHGDKAFVDKVNKIIETGVEGITFKHNLSHRDSCYEIATSDIGICWRKNGWGDNGEISTKIKEYELYGVFVEKNKLKDIENILIDFYIKILTTYKYSFISFNKYNIFKSIYSRNKIKIMEKIIDDWIYKVSLEYKSLLLPKNKFFVLYCKSVHKITSIGGYVERGHQILKAHNNSFSKYYYICIDSTVGIRKKIPPSNIINIVDNVINITMPLITEFKGKHNYFTLEAYNYIVKLFNICLIHSPSFYKHSLLALIASKINNIPHVYEVRGRFDITLYEKMIKSDKLLYSNNEKLVEICSSGIFYITEECRKYVENTDNIKNIQSEILLNCSTYDKNNDYKNIEEFNMFPDDSNIRFIIGYMGSTYHYENFELIIKTVDILIKKYPDIGFIYAGNCVEEAIDLLNKIKKKYVNNIIKCGYLSHIDLITKYYPNIDIFVIPRKDILVSNIISPLKPYELFLQKVPLLMSNVDCLKRISCNENNCLLFDIKSNNSDENFYQKIIEVYENGYPKYLIDNAYYYAKRNTWNNTVEIIEKFYNNIIEI